jgi:hypothetical protein
MTFLHAVKQMEKVAGVTPGTTRGDLREVTHEESRQYFQWLRRQAPLTALCLPYFEDLTHVPQRTQA